MSDFHLALITSSSVFPCTHCIHPAFDKRVINLRSALFCMHISPGRCARAVATSHDHGMMQCQRDFSPSAWHTGRALLEEVARSLSIFKPCVPKEHSLTAAGRQSSCYRIGPCSHTHTRHRHPNRYAAKHWSLEPIIALSRSSSQWSAETGCLMARRMRIIEIIHKKHLLN